MKYIICFAGLLFSSTLCLSQTKRFLYYFDKEFNLIPKAQSVFTGIGTNENGLLKLSLYSNETNEIVAVEHFTDSSLQLQQGLFQSYYSNSFPEREGNYLDGNEEGLWKRWDTLGRTVDSSIYSNGKKIMQTEFNYNNKGILSSVIMNDIKADRLKKTFYNDTTGQVVSEVDFTGQKGTVKTYKDGVLANADTVFSRNEVEASFPGGDAAWTKYIIRQIQRYGDEIIKTGEEGTCRVRFIIDGEGNVTDVKAINMEDSQLAKIAVKIVSKSPKWVPASQYGRRVKAFREQPVSFQIANN